MLPRPQPTTPRPVVIATAALAAAPLSYASPVQPFQPAPLARFPALWASLPAAIGQTAAITTGTTAVAAAAAANGANLLAATLEIWRAAAALYGPFPNPGSTKLLFIGCPRRIGLAPLLWPETKERLRVGTMQVHYGATPIHAT